MSQLTKQIRVKRTRSIDFGGIETYYETIEIPVSSTEAIIIANDIKFGLSSSIFTNNLNHAMMFIKKTEVGFTHVNLMTSLKESQLPFGGIKESGVGMPEAGKSGLEFFTNQKSIYIKY